MENMMTIYTNAEFGDIRTIQEADKILFCAKDIVAALQYRDTVNAIKQHCRWVVKRHLPHPQSPEKVIEMSFIPEGDVYRLIVGSKLPSAQKFEHWLFDDVVPTIRRHGMYVSESLFEQAAKLPGILEHAIDRLIAERNRADELSEKLEAIQPKADYFDAFVNPCNCTSIRDMAKELQIPERQFCKFLIAEKLMYRCPAGNLMPYNKKSNEGLFIVRDFCTKTGYFGSYTLITPAGKDAIRLMLCRD